jgi:hypothetical protein
MTVEDPDRRAAPGLSGRELTVIILTVMVVAVALILTLVSLRMMTDCGPGGLRENGGMPGEIPYEAAFLAPLACVIPLGLGLA